MNITPFCCSSEMKAHANPADAGEKVNPLSPAVTSFPPKPELNPSHSEPAHLYDRAAACTPAPLLMDQIQKLDCSNALAKTIQKNIVQFIRRIDEIELPLYQAECIKLRKYVDYLATICSDDLLVLPEQVKEIQKTFSDISCLYPVIPETCEPAVYQLLETLLDAGVINIEKACYSPLFASSFLYELHEKRIPFRLFSRICDRLLETESFRKQFLFNRSEYVIINSDSAFLEYWVQKAKQYLSQGEAFAQCYKNALTKSLRELSSIKINNYSESLLKEIDKNISFSSIIKEVCKVDYSSVVPPIRIGPLRDSIRILSQLLFKSPTASPLLKTHIENLNCQNRISLLLASFMTHDFRLVNFLLDQLPDITPLLNWRDKNEKNLFHYEVMGSALLNEPNSDFFILLQTHRALTSLFLCSDNEGTTPLESCYRTDSADVEMDSIAQTPFMPILEHSLNTMGSPQNVDDFISAVTPKNGFQAWLLIHLVQKGLNPECLGINETTAPDRTFAHSFKALLCQYKPLTTPEQQTGFLTKAGTLGFSLKATEVLIQAFPVTVRKAFMEAPFSKKNQAVWKSQVLPLSKYYHPGVPTWDLLPWSDFLKKAFLCYEPHKDEDILDDWHKCLDSVTKQQQLSEFNALLPNGERGVYGRSCFFTSPEGAGTLRLKFRKNTLPDSARAEAWDEFASEPVKLNCLRAFQSSGRLPLKSNLPEPVGMYKISHFSHWLLQSGLDPKDRESLSKQVFVEEDGSACVYIYKTKPSEHYHLYPYDVKPNGLPPKTGLKALRLAAHDLGLLARAGLAATVLPMYHDESTNRHYVILAQLCGKMCPGVLDSWDDQATSYPNISPGVGIRDYADILPFDQLPSELEKTVQDTPDNRRKIHMEQISREFFSLMLLLPRTLGDQLNYRDEQSVQQLASEILEITTLFFGNAFDIPCEDIARTMNTYGIPDRLAREISFWCDPSEFPDWVRCIRRGAIPETVYPQAHRTSFNNGLGDILTDKGAFNTTKSKGRNLGHRNGMLPIQEVNKLLTLMFYLYAVKFMGSAT